MPSLNASFTRRRFLAASTACAVGSSLHAAQSPPQLRAGAAISDITLPLGASNGGVILRGGPATQVHDDLNARCLALDDGRTQVAIAVCDIRMISREVIDRAKALVHAATGLPPGQMLISATHTHAAPAAMPLSDAAIDRWYLEFLPVRIADGIRRALGNLAPARIGWGASDQPQHVFNRRWRLKPGTIPPNPFGETTDHVQMNPPRNSPNLIESAGPVDPQLSIVALQHADGRPLAMLANYGLHYVGGYRGGHVSADYFAVFSERVKELLAAEGQDPPFVAMMTNGTSGDVNNINFRESPPGATPPWTKMREVAHDLADKALATYRQLSYQDRPAISVRTAELELGVRRPTADRLAWARKIVGDIQNQRSLTRPQIYASEALELAKFPTHVPVKLQAIRIGELAIAAIPCEVFAETGLAIKAESPLRPTFTIELANGYNGYLPTSQQHELGGYETWPARSAYLEPQAEPQIRATVLDLLRQVGDG